MQNSLGSNIKTLHRIVDGRVEALEFGVTASFPYVGRTLKDIQLRDGLLIAGIVHPNGDTVIPSGKDVLQVGDDVIIVTTKTDLTDLRDIVKE